MTEYEIVKNILFEKLDFIFINEQKSDSWKLDLYGDDTEYLVIVRTEYPDGDIIYDFDKATAYGDYIDDFWDTENDYIEGKAKVSIIAYSPLWLGKQLCSFRERMIEV